MGYGRAVPDGVALAPVVDEGASSGATFSTLTNPDGDGINYRLAVWTANGTLVVTTAGEAESLIIGGGGGSTRHVGAGSGGGGYIRDGKRILPAGTLTVTIGAGGVGDSPAGAPGGSAGGDTSIGSVTAQGAGFVGGQEGARQASSITGTSVTYSTPATQADGTQKYGDGGQASATYSGNGKQGVVYLRWRIV